MQTQLENAIEIIEEDFMCQSNWALKQASNIRILFNDNKNEELYKQIADIERTIDGFEVKVEDAIIRCIVLYSPKAGELRKLMALYDMATYVERIGDLLNNIKGFAKRIDLNGNVFGQFGDLFEKQFENVVNRVQNAIFAFSYKDAALAKTTIISDRDVDDLHKQIVLLLGQYEFSKIASQQEVKDILYLSNLSYNLERIGDHANNIAEAALFLIEGKNVKHTDLC